MSDHEPMQISEGELRAMTAELDERHQATLPAMHEHVAELVGTATTRRSFLLGGAGALGGLALTACGGGGKKKAKPKTAQVPAGDIQFAATSASIEILAVQTYDAAIQAAQQGKLGPQVPPAVTSFATTARKQHQEHADAWNAIVRGANKPAVAQPDPAIKPTVDQQLAQVKDIPSLARLALELENVAAATYLSAVGQVQSQQTLATAASIQPVEMQHAAILNFVLGQYPIPDSFAKRDKARPATDLRI